MTTRGAEPTLAPRKVVFIDNFFYHAENGRLQVEISPHLGLMSLATVLETAGHSVEIFDPKRLFAMCGFAEPDTAFVEAWAAEICLSFPDVIGFTAYGLSFPFVVATAAAVRRRRPALPILLGGPHATILAQEILEAFDCFDAVARFECETNILDIVEAFTGSGDPSGISGITYRDGEGIKTCPMRAGLIDMGEVPRPALHLYPIDAGGAELPLEAGRGCPFDCTFCSTASYFQRRYRVKPNEALVAEMHWAQQAKGISRFNLNHDLFGLKRETLLDFCDRVEGSGYGWSCSMRPDQVDASLGRRLKQAGCTDVYFGFETGSQRLQRVIKKKLDLKTVERDFAGFLAEGPRVTVSYITGFPDETIADQNASLDAIGDQLKLNPQRVMAQMHMLAPEPGTELDRTHPDTLIDDFGPENTPVPFPELVRAHPRIFSVFRYFPGLIPRLRVREASVFVQELLPRLGYPLVVHLTEHVFAGRLSCFFETCKTPAERDEAETADLSAEDLMDAMVRRLDRHLASRGHSYLREMIRFRRACTILPQAYDPPPKSAHLAVLGLDVSADGWLVGRFSCDVLALAAQLSEAPMSSPMDLPGRDQQVSIALRRDASGTLHSLAFEGEPG